MHGNGPQVGNILIQQASRRGPVAPMPMDVAGAMSQGQIGYLLVQTLENHLRRLRRATPVACLVTETIVDAADPGFANPTKPVGPFYDEARGAHADARERLRHEGGRRPRLAPRGALPGAGRDRPARRHPRAWSPPSAWSICVGGGGIPVLRASGSLSGTAAVIDKDLAAAKLALDIGADALLVLTDVPAAYLDYRAVRTSAPWARSPWPRWRAYVADGHFKAGSMGPKVEACLRVARAGGTGIIAALTEAIEAVEGTAGTRIVPDGAGRTAAEPAEAGAAASRKPAAKRPAKATGANKKAARRQPAKSTRRSGEAVGGANVIDITTARRRAVAE